MSALNELHGRIDQRSRQRARGGRHWFGLAKQILYSKDEFGGLIKTSPLETEGGGGNKENTADSPPIRSFELTTDDHALEYLNALFDAAVERGLDPLIERRKGQTLLRVICSACDWASVKMEALRK